MPEGDTIFRAATVLRAALVGGTVRRFEASRLTGEMPAPGDVVEAVEARGKHLLVRFASGFVLRTHQRMTGSWHLYRSGERWKRPAWQARVVIEVDDRVAVCFNAPDVELTRDGDRRRPGAVDALGPDLCLPDADLDEAVARMAHLVGPDAELGVVMLDQRIACGVGNVYKCEALWACRLDPFAPLGALDAAGRRSLLDTASRQLRANLDSGRRVTVPGGLAVYGRAGKRCRRCDGTVAMRRQGEQARSTYWCPSCQVLPART